jgi:hypothetical protein
MNTKKFRRFAVGAAVVLGAVTLPVGAASAGPGGTQGPGGCLENPGGLVRLQNPPRGGPNTSVVWSAAPGAPNTPGQAVKNVCIRGNP